MMKADVTAENKPAYSRNRVRVNVGVCGRNAHKYQRGVQVFIVSLDKAVIMVVRRALEFIVKLACGVASSLEPWKEALQCFEYSLLYAKNNGKKAD